MQWNPEVATQVMVASDDDMAPALQLWDLRNSVSPVMELHGHAKVRVVVCGACMCLVVCLVVCVYQGGDLG